MSYFSPSFYELKDALVVAEMQILKRLGFNVHVALPYGTLVNYLRVLNLTNREDACQKAWGYLNDAYVSSLSVLFILTFINHSLQTPVYALYPVPSIVSAAIMLTARQLSIPLPSDPPNCWWTLFDAEWEDIWSIAGYIMRLYRKRSTEEKALVMRLVNKKEVRRWIEEYPAGSSTT